MMTANFSIPQQPQMHFGWGIRHAFKSQLLQYNFQHLVVISSRFLTRPGQFSADLVDFCHKNDMRVSLFSVSGEPSPELVDEIVASCGTQNQAVLGIGGGSVLDTAKAVAGLIPSRRSVMDFLEGVGKGEVFNESTLPFIALPTTAGTGSETTKNAVLSKLGHYKKSFRSDKLLAKAIWLDPEFLVSCPKDVLFNTGMDAFTQLLESYTTLKANPFTDALAWQGMQLFKDAFENIETGTLEQQQVAYGNLMLAASFSGTTLANAGLGAVHGLAGPIGAFFEAPHGAVCANLLAPISALNIQTLQTQDSHSAQNTLTKYAQISQLLTPDSLKQSIETQLKSLIEQLDSLSNRYVPQKLQDFGLSADNLEPVISSCRAGSMLGNPVTLSDQQLRSAITHSL
ncbi:iron-containing alcohol dehydrogenase [Thiosulfativibrio zosterae]|nr:iron-containing alcohol dehydrogenase [Thiosulfativibrio zosterae]